LIRNNKIIKSVDNSKPEDAKTFYSNLYLNDH